MKSILALAIILTGLNLQAETAKTPPASTEAKPVAKAAAPAQPVGSYQLKLEVAVNGKHVASPTMTLEPNQKAILSQKGEDGETYIIEVIATPQEKKVVKMDFTVSHEVNGKPELISNAQTITKERKGATITVNKSDGSEQLSLKVWAKKITSSKK